MTDPGGRRSVLLMHCLSPKRCVPRIGTDIAVRMNETIEKDIDKCGSENCHCMVGPTCDL